MTSERAIRTAVAAWNMGVEQFVARMTPDVEFHAPPGFPEGDMWKGRDNVAAVLHDMFGSVFNEVSYELHDLTRGRRGWLLRARESVKQERGLDLGWQEWTVIELDGELISGVWVFYDRAAAEEQAGV